MRGSLKDKLRALEQQEAPPRVPRLRDDLERLYRRGEERKSFPDEQVTRDRRRMHEFVEGYYENTAFGDVFVSRRQFPWEHLHGRYPLDRLQSIHGNWLSRLGQFPGQPDFDLERTVFMDTETTGLAGGSGTLAFLVGLGFVEAAGFTVLGFFADTFNREEGMLELVSSFIEPYRNVITFNGKTYDLPLLETRYILKHQTSPFAALAHLDLLHIARQIWGYDLDNCRLQTLEKEILGFQRQDDLPGAEVPAAWFKYIQGRGADPLYRVFEHNALDILSLAVLAPLVWDLTRPDGGSPEARLSQSRLLQKHGETAAARAILGKLIRSGRSGEDRQRGRRELARIHKRHRDWQAAGDLWEAMLASERIFYLEPYVELAMVCEHRLRDYHRALKYVTAALNGISPGRIRERAQLLQRRQRLEKKIRKASACEQS